MAYGNNDYSRLEIVAVKCAICNAVTYLKKDKVYYICNKCKANRNEHRNEQRLPKRHGIPYVSVKKVPEYLQKFI